MREGLMVRKLSFTNAEAVDPKEPHFTNSVRILRVHPRLQNFVPEMFRAGRQLQLQCV